ncbi:glycogen synthase [Planctomycetota bacterium]
MRVTFVAAESVPFAKVGGLGDVVGALPEELARLGFEVTTILPWYPGIPVHTESESSFRFAGAEEHLRVGEIEQRGVRILFLGLPDFLRDGIYGYPDDVQRFVRFSLAAAALIETDVAHVHDWHSALLPALSHAGRLRARATVLTVHNIAHQGSWDPGELLHWTGLPGSFVHPDRMEYYGSVNLMKAGLTFADAITTVSATYGREIQTPEFGMGLDGIVRRQSKKLLGIPNGIDVTYWNPATDPHLEARYDRSNMGGKTLCQEALARDLGLAPPILGVVSRLVHQKGLDIVRDGLPALLDMGYSLAVLGAGDPGREHAWAEAARGNPGRVHYTRGRNEPLAHRIFAGSAGLLIPSRFEPCGLTQLIGLRYGTPPLAHAVGGLVDTIDDGRTGILFRPHTSEALLEGARRLRHSESRDVMIELGMDRDVSWKRSAAEYGRLYRQLLE